MSLPSVALLAFLPANAAADHYDSLYPTGHTGNNCSDGFIGDGACRTDNSTVTYHLRTISSNLDTPVQNRIDTQYKVTDLSFVEHSNPVYSGNAETDIIIDEHGWVLSSYGWIGVTWCNDAVSGQRCDQHYIYFDSGWYASHSYTPDRIGNACHELGHAIGLKHGSLATPIGGTAQPTNTWTSLRCLRIPSSTYPYAGSHNKDQINAHW